MTVAASILELVITMVWACLQVPGAQNQLFAQLFFALDVVSDIAGVASLTFASGLMDALQAPSPPDVQWFKNLPAKHVKRWGVYVLVFEHEDFIPYLYCGSATEVSCGVTQRWALYDKHNLYLRDNTEGLPSGVIKAFQAGFKITYKGLLVSAPIATAAKVPMVRLLFYAMEATFAFAFWMMNSHKFLLYHACCPWPLESFTYGGLCTHSALRDPIAGRFDLSGEELEALAVDVKERNRRYNALYYQREKQVHPERLKERQREHDLNYRINSHDKPIAKQRRFAAKRKADRTYWCELCEQACTKEYEWDRQVRQSQES